MKMLCALLLALPLAACGPTIGDACTTSSDCGVGTCLNRAYAPGGLCTQSCVVGGDTCPSGSTCVRGAIDGDLAGCLRSCRGDSDCRAGYTCRTERESVTQVCTGGSGL